MCFSVAVWISNIPPVTVSISGDQFYTFFHKQRKEIFGKVKVVSFGDIVKNFRLYNIDTGIDRITENFSPAWFFQKFFYFTFFVGDHHTKLKRVFYRSQSNCKFRFFLLVIVEYFLKIKICHQVTTDDDKVLITDVCLCQFDRTCSTIIIIRNYVSDIYTEFTSVTKIVLDHFRFKIE